MRRVEDGDFILFQKRSNWSSHKEQNRGNLLVVLAVSVVLLCDDSSLENPLLSIVAALIVAASWLQLLAKESLKSDVLWPL